MHYFSSVQCRRLYLSCECIFTYPSIVYRLTKTKRKKFLRKKIYAKNALLFFSIAPETISELRMRFYVALISLSFNKNEQKKYFYGKNILRKMHYFLSVQRRRLYLSCECIFTYPSIVYRLTKTKRKKFLRKKIDAKNALFFVGLAPETIFELRIHFSVALISLSFDKKNRKKILRKSTFLINFKLIFSLRFYKLKTFF